MKTLKIPNSEKISIIIVNYQSGQYLERCVASIFKHTNREETEVIVVNNDEKESFSALEHNFPEIKVINDRKNIGFGKASNLGAKDAKGSHLLFLNPDTELLGNYTKALKVFLKDQEIGIAGPKLIDEKGRLQEWIAGVEVSLIELIKNNLGLGESKKRWRSETKKEVDWVSGAALGIKRELFEHLGGFDEKIFMYFEDIDICKRARAGGKKVVYFPKEKIRHFGGGSMRSRKEQKKHYYASQDYYFQKHYGKNYARLVRFLRKIFTRENV